MIFELKRFARSAYLVVAIGLSVLFFIGGYAWGMPSHPDGVPYAVLFEAVYTVYCQFGQLILSAFAMHSVANDYADKNILFYRELGFDSTRYYLCKVTTMSCALIASYGVCSLVCCAIYQDFSLWAGMLLQVAALIVTYVSIFCLVALVVGKFVPSYFAYIVWWIGVSAAVSIGPDWIAWLQPFDQNAGIYLTTVEHLANSPAFLGSQAHTILTCVIYTLVVLAIGALISFIIKRRWLRNGV